jgi:hypothetical protein
MKKMLLLATVSILLFASCKNDIDITADYKETPIIYGLLNLDSTTHYIKVYKAFLDEETSAVDIAQNPDSIYYADSIILSVERKSNGQKTYLSRIDGNSIGRPMEDGVFANSPNILYTFTQVLNKDETYILNFENPRTGVKASAETKLVNDFQINAPFEGFNFNFTSVTPFEVQWRAAANSRINDVTLRFYYFEWNIATSGNKILKWIDWRVANGIISNNANGGEQLSFPIEGNSFYSFLSANLPADAQLRREAPQECIEVLFSVGGETLYNYIRVNQAQSGITSLQTLTEFTNVQGGLGIFSTRKISKRSALGLTNLALDSLSCGNLTRELNFVNRNCF